MKQEILKTREGKESVVGMPETLEELVVAFGAKRLFKAGLAAYKTRCLRQIRRGSKPRERVVKIKLSQLNDSQKDALSHAGLLPEQD